MTNYDYDLIGVDLKSRRKAVRIRKNRFRPTRSRWLLPAILLLASLGVALVDMR
jgi:hypothetical protein